MKTRGLWHITARFMHREKFETFYVSARNRNEALSIFDSIWGREYTVITCVFNG